MIQKQKQRNNGFTLIEIILYFVLTSIMIGVLGGIGVNVLSGNAKAHAVEEVGYTAQFAFEKLRTAVKDAESVLLPTGSATSSVLKLSMSNVSESPTIFEVSDGVLVMTKGSSSPVILSTDRVTISKFILSDMSDTGGTSLIKILVHIQAINKGKRKEYEAGKTFYTTIGIPK